MDVGSWYRPMIMSSSIKRAMLLSTLNPADNLNIINIRCDFQQINWANDHFLIFNLQGEVLTNHGYKRRFEILSKKSEKKDIFARIFEISTRKTFRIDIKRKSHAKQGSDKTFCHSVGIS